jgi:hypothetical protein
LETTPTKAEIELESWASLNPINGEALLNTVKKQIKK